MQSSTCIAAMVTALSLATALPAWGSAYSTAVMNANPIAYWRFEDPSSANGATATDAMGNYHGVYTNGATLDSNTAGHLGGTAAEFDGSNQRATFGALGGLGSSLGGSGAGTGVTFEFWIKTTEDRGLRRMFGTFNEGSGTVIAMVANSTTGGNSVTGATTLFIRDDDNNSLSTSFATNIYDGEWHHVVWRLEDLANNGTSGDGGPNAKNPFSLWIDGEEVALASYGGSLGPVANFSDFDNPFRIGQIGRAEGTSLFTAFAGQFDEFAIYDYLLTPEQIAQHYAAAMPEPGAYVLFGLGGLGLLVIRRRLRG